MLFRFVSLIPFICLIFAPIVADSQEELPFWRKKTKLYEQIKTQRRVVVSVKEESGKEGQKFRMVGAGAVNVPVEFAVKQIMEFEKLPSVSSYFKKVVHKKKEKQIYIVLEALGYQARMRLEYKWHKDGRQMDWRVIWGPFKGMLGHYQFQSLSQDQTEVSIWSTFKNPKLPVPQFLMKFTLEVIAEKVAQKMRSFIESEYKRTKE